MELYPQNRDDVLTEIAVTESLIMKFRDDQKCVNELQELLDELIASLHKLESLNE